MYTLSEDMLYIIISKNTVYVNTENARAVQIKCDYSKSVTFMQHIRVP